MAAHLGAHQAYEVWQYMNQKGYYQVPTMKEMTTDTMAQSYTTANIAMANQKMPMMGMEMPKLDQHITM